MKKLLTVIVVFSVVLSTVWAAGKQDSSKKPVKLGTVLHIAGIPFCEQIATGAKNAGKDFNVHVELSGPSQLNADTQIAMFNTLVALE